MLHRQLTVVATLVCLLLGHIGRAQLNPEFTLSIAGPCRQTIEGPPGSAYDDGTGGTDLFFDDWFRRMPNKRPGHTWDVALTTRNNPDNVWGVQAWAWGLAAEGVLEITDVTTFGTVGCHRGDGPTCRRGSVEECTVVTGPPYGVGGEENRGALSWILMSTFGVPHVEGPPEGVDLLAKLRVFGRFPEEEGQQVIGRLLFVEHLWAPCYPAEGRVLPLNIIFHRRHTVAETLGDPRLRIEHCEVRFVAANTSRFLRCDANDDGRLQVDDAVWLLGVLFRGLPPTACPAAADCNADGARDLSDALYALYYLFAGGPPPPAPFPGCGRILGLDPEACPLGSTRCGSS
jgi:hypothetical protein